MRTYLRQVLWACVGAAPVMAAAVGFARLWKYENTAGVAAQAPSLWPGSTLVDCHSGLSTVVMLIHPRCPCSKASVEELGRIMAHCHGELTATVLMIRPEGAPKGWEQTDLWRS